jgi:two-component system alkaline phosphatase synthesis response regulator PhoP
MKRILIVEDDSNLRELYKNAFSGANYVVFDEGDVSKALRILGEKEFEVILLDLLFPSTDGVEVIKTLRLSNSLNNQTPIVVLTNVSADEKITEALESGANKYLFKAQFTPKAIVKEVDALLQNQENPSN